MSGAPVNPRRAADHEHRTGRVLRVRRPPCGQAVERRRRARRRGRHVGLRRDADVGDDDPRREALRPGSTAVAELAAVEADRDVGADRGAGDDARSRRRRPRARRGRRSPGRRRASPRSACARIGPRRAAKARCRAARRRRRRRAAAAAAAHAARASAPRGARRSRGSGARRRGSLPESPASRHSTSQPAACRWRATTNPSPPLLPAAADDGGASGAARTAQDLVGGCEAGALHEHRAGDAERRRSRPRRRRASRRRRRAGAGRSCVVRRRRRPPPSPWSASCERSIAPARTRSAHAAVRPVRLTPGLGRPAISISRHVNGTPKPSALPTASLPANRAAKCCGRVGPRQAVLALGRREDALDEARVALERTGHPVDLDQVDPNPHAGHTMLGPCQGRSR